MPATMHERDCFCYRRRRRRRQFFSVHVQVCR